MKDTVVAQTRLFSEEFLSVFEQTWVAIPNWKWIAIATAIGLGLALRPMLQYLVEKAKRSSPWYGQQGTFAANILSLKVETSLAWIVVLMFWLAVIDNLALTIGLNKYLTLVSQILLAYHLIHLVYQGAEAAGLMMLQVAAKTENTLDDQLAPFAAKTLKVVVVVLGVLVALQNFGMNVMGLLAGLGLGGLALALAAQDTAANLFGSITILLDRPFVQGDFIKLADTEGVVEEIGFRSTRLRTPYNSLITLPNSLVAKEKIDNYQARPRRRLRQILGLLYETPPAKIEEFSVEAKKALAADPSVDQNDIVVSFMNFNAASLDVLVQFHLPGVKTFAEEMEISQRTFKTLIDVAARIGVEFAYPTQTLYLKGIPQPAEREMSAPGVEISPPL